MPRSHLQLNQNIWGWDQGICIQCKSCRGDSNVQSGMRAMCWEYKNDIFEVTWINWGWEGEEGSYPTEIKLKNNEYIDTLKLARIKYENRCLQEFVQSPVETAINLACLQNLYSIKPLIPRTNSCH